MNKKLYITATITTVCLLLIAGTFAWTNFSASIINSFLGSGSDDGNVDTGPGGTLHNDFEEGKDYRDVYVENWGTEPLIVRIKLTEYMEIGEGAGNENGAENNHATSVVDGASIDDPNTWTPFDGDMGEGIHRSTNGFRYYWNWTMGGQKRYFQAPEDLRGTQDENGVDFVSTTGPVGNTDDLPSVYRLTLDAEVLSMAEWIDRGRPLGHYWVVDVDGYSYWAAPLEPEEATGLLLHKVELNNRPIEDFYYAINVAAHMATIDDAPDNYERLLYDASESASILINKIAEKIRNTENNTTNSVTIVSNGTEFEPYRHFLGAMTYSVDGYLSVSGIPLPLRLREISDLLPVIQYSDGFQIFVDGNIATNLSFSLFDDNYHFVYSNRPILELPDDSRVYIASFSVSRRTVSPIDPERFDTITNNYVFKITR